MLTCRSLGLEADASKTFMQVLTNMKFAMRINNATLHATHGGQDRLGGTGQGNLLSVSICVAQSCVMFKFLEGTHEGIIIRGPVGEEEISRLILAYVDDEDAFTEGENALRNAQKLIAHAVQLFSVTGAMTSIEKTKCLLWQLTNVDGNHYLQHCKTE